MLHVQYASQMQGVKWWEGNGYNLNRRWNQMGPKMYLIFCGYFIIYLFIYLVIVVKDESYMIAKTNLFRMDDYLFIYLLV